MSQQNPLTFMLTVVFPILGVASKSLIFSNLNGILILATETSKMPQKNRENKPVSRLCQYQQSFL
jgi:hypothetical protein